MSPEAIDLRVSLEVAERVEEILTIAMRALNLSIDVIQQDYCSHTEPHSADLTSCYAQNLLQAVRRIERLNK